jgi:flavin-dependent dehydrogenase
MRATDVAVIGGGVAGLAAAILFVQQGFSVTVLEKGDYPRHKVCGEYLSRESKPLLERLRLEEDLEALPFVNRLEVTTTGNAALYSDLPLGGIGWSRYAMDTALARAAERQGVTIYTDTKVESVVPAGEEYVLTTAAGELRAKLVVGSWGRKGNLDVQLQRPFLTQRGSKLDGWVGIKHQVRSAHLPADLISLHNFAGGYCGVSPVEEGVHCVCYLVHEEALKAAGSIAGLEANVLGKNAHLKALWAEADFLYERPLTVSGVSFRRRSPVEGGVLLCGDTAGVIPPLCGNGMSMGLRAAQLALQCSMPFLKGAVRRQVMERNYTAQWQQAFKIRLWAGRQLQSRFGNERLLAPAMKLLNTVPFLKKAVIRATHGTPF